MVARLLAVFFDPHPKSLAQAVDQLLNQLARNQSAHATHRPKPNARPPPIDT